MDLYPQSHQKIELLPEHIIDQIKAGEVVDRPANLIKEIIENALDAHANQLDLHLVGEGMDLISLIDNGIGIEYEDLPLAFCRHATSKISRFDDIYRLNTFGFRGEALASISAISHLTCTSQKMGEKTAGKVTLEGGRLTSHSKESTSLKQGTALYIKDLFYNTPARLKFIKSKSSEKNAIQKIIESFIISNPQASFTLKWDDQDKFIYKNTHGDQKERVEQVFTPKSNKEQELVHFSQDFEGHSVLGFLSPNSVRSHSKRKQFLFVNGRLFYDKQIHSLICRVMDSRGWFQGSGSYCLFIKAPPSQIDVNVHPSKTTIKFLKHSMLLSMISNSLKAVLKPKVQQLESFPEQSYKTQTPIESFDAYSSNFSTESTNINYNFDFQEKNLPSTPSQGLQQTVEIKNHPTLQVVTINEDQFIFHKVKFLQLIFSFILEKEVEEINLTPLLISEPISLKEHIVTSKDINALRKLGFIVEKLDDEMTVVRAVHHFFVSNQVQNLVKLLIQSDYNIEGLNQINFNFSQSFLESILNDQWVSRYSQNFMLPLFSKKVEGLFS